MRLLERERGAVGARTRSADDGSGVHRGRGGGDAGVAGEQGAGDVHELRAAQGGGRSVQYFYVTFVLCQVESDNEVKAKTLLDERSIIE